MSRKKTSIAPVIGLLMPGILGCVATGLITHLVTKNTIEPEKIEVPVFQTEYIQLPAETIVEYETLYVPVAPLAEDEKRFSLTDEERAAVEKCVAAEVRFAYFEDMLGVAQVIRDKAEHPNRAAYGGPTVMGVLESGHYMGFDGEIENYPLVQKAVSLVFDEGFRLYDETTTIYFNPETSDPEQMALLRNYTFVGSTPYTEFRSDKLISEVTDE